MIEVAEIKEAHKLLSGLLGSNVALVLFASRRLLPPDKALTVTGTLAGQIVMEG